MVKTTQQATLAGIKVAVLISDGFEISEFEGPVAALQAAGATVEVLAQTHSQVAHGIQAISHMELRGKTKPQKALIDASPADYQALLIPGGALSCDRMRQSRLHLAFVQNFIDAHKPLAVICHGGWLLADAGVLRGRTLTSWPAIRKDLERAGAVWKDEAVVRDQNLITSRGPDDLPAFTQAFIEELEKTKHPGGEAAA